MACRLVFFSSSVLRAPRFMLDRGRGMVTLVVRFGWCQDAEGGWWLLDSGYGPAAEPGAPGAWDWRLYRAALRPRATGWTPSRAFAALGAEASAVRGTILSHFHADHTGGLADPLVAQLPVVVPKKALRWWQGATPWHRRLEGVFADGMPRLPDALWRPLPLGGEAAPGVVGVNLPGHAVGHTGLRMHTEHGPALWAVDAAWTMDGLDPGRGPRWPLSRLGPAPMDAEATRANVLAERQSGVHVVLCHDPAPSPFDHPSVAEAVARAREPR